MREHVKIEVAMEILSTCMSIAILNKDENSIEEISRMKNKVYMGDQKVIEKIIANYGRKVKSILEVDNG